jgi:hypothetical protein
VENVKVVEKVTKQETATVAIDPAEKKLIDDVLSKKVEIQQVHIKREKANSRSR